MLRLVSTGLCAACVVLLATFEPVRIETPPAPPVSEIAPSPLSIVDALAELAPSGLASLIHLAHLAPDERIQAINDRPLDSDLEAGAQLASLALHAGEYVDLTVSNGATERRVLVLLH
jgi:hypothetical protein